MIHQFHSLVHIQKMQTPSSKRYLHTDVLSTLLMIAKIWKQPIYINRKIHIEDVRYIYIYIMVYIYKNEILPFTAMQMDLEIIILSEVSQIKTNTVQMESKNKTNIYSKTENRLTGIGNKQVVISGERGGERYKIGTGTNITLQ